MNKRELGSQKEKKAAEYLVKKGYKIVDMNFRCRIGEIDIIAEYNDTLIFVEVKYRKNNKFGTAIEAVSPLKQSVIRKVAQYYIVTKLHKCDVLCRFDVIGIDDDEVTHIIDAF